MKKLLLLLVAVLSVSCAPLMKYEPPKIDPPKKMEHYQLPPDPFKDLEAPKPIFLAKDENGLWKEVPKEQGTLIAYFPKEHDKIVLRLQYYKEIVPQLVNFVNVVIELNNARIELQVDERLAKEVYKQLWIDTQNNRITDQRWDTVNKAGMYAIIIGLLINLGLAL